MAIKGLSIPVFGKYNNNNRVVTYAEGIINPHAVSYTVAVESSDNNPLYADNRIVENDKGTFNGGTLTLETDDLVQEVSKYLLGLKEITRTYGENKTVTALVYDDSQDSPYLGMGIIEEHQINDVNQYRAVWLKKVTFIIPEEAATTRGESIDWQTKTIEGTISRSDETGENGTYPWQEAAWFASEGEALTYLKDMLGVGKAGILTVTSTAGEEAGSTKITVIPAKTGTNIYKYQISDTVESPAYDADCSAMETWNGTDDIQATNGGRILIVECTSDAKARRAGSATVMVKE